jgi:hypothetical protein
MNNTWTLLKQTFLSLPEPARFLVIGFIGVLLIVFLTLIFGPFFIAGLILTLAGTCAIAMLSYIAYTIWKDEL